MFINYSVQCKYKKKNTSIQILNQFKIIFQEQQILEIIYFASQT